MEIHPLTYLFVQTLGNRAIAATLKSTVQLLKGVHKYRMVIIAKIRQNQLKNPDIVESFGTSCLLDHAD